MGKEKKQEINMEVNTEVNIEECVDGVKCGVGSIITESWCQGYERKAGVLILTAAEGGTVYAERARVFRTGVNIELPAGYVGLLQPDRKLNEDNGVLCQGMILPEGLQSVNVTLYNRGSGICDIQQGQAIARLIVVPVVEIGG